MHTCVHVSQSKQRCRAPIIFSLGLGHIHYQIIEYGVHQPVEGLYFRALAAMRSISARKICGVVYIPSPTAEQTQKGRVECYCFHRKNAHKHTHVYRQSHDTPALFFSVMRWICIGFSIILRQSGTSLQSSKECKAVKSNKVQNFFFFFFFFFLFFFFFFFLFPQGAWIALTPQEVYS